MSLLNEARAIQPRQPTRDSYTKEDEELVLGWLSGEIGLSQVMRVKNITSNGAYSYVARVARKIFSSNGLNPKRKK